MSNILIEVAQRYNRDYITPEDVSEAINDGADLSQIRLDLLELLGRRTGYGVEDKGLCAFIAWRGEADKEADDA